VTSIDAALQVTDTQVHEIRRHHELEALENLWDRLAAGVVPQEFATAITWARHHVADGDLRVLYRKEPAALLPLYLDRRFTIRTLRLFGDDNAALDHGGILFDSSVASNGFTQPGEAFGLHLGAAKGKWDTMVLDAIPCAQPQVELLVDSLGGAGMRVDRDSQMSVWQIELPSTWEEYLLRLSKSHRKKIRRSIIDLEEAEQSAYTCAIAPAEIPQAFDAFVDLHLARRRSIHQPSSFTSPHFVHFQRALASALAARGQIRLWQVTHGTKVVATSYDTSSAHSTYGYQGGFDPEFDLYDASRAVQAITIRSAIERGHRLYDFGRGDLPYKAHWRAEPLPVETVRITQNKPRAIVANQNRAALNRLRATRLGDYLVALRDQRQRVR
jgi:CelD/BcsL family acetyltransferase involved in cellulose biosynthesis